MRPTILLAALLAAGLLGAPAAEAQFNPNRHGHPSMKQADRHNPFAGGSATTRQGATFSVPHAHHGHIHPGLGFGYYPSYGYGYPSNPYGYYPQYGYPVYRGPVYVNPGSMFGPRALMRQLYGQ